LKSDACEIGDEGKSEKPKQEQSDNVSIFHQSHNAVEISKVMFNTCNVHCQVFHHFSLMCGGMSEIFLQDLLRLLSESPKHDTALVEPEATIHLRL
jgi:hypothetical protein